MRRSRAMKSAIGRMARQIVDAFDPEKVILFGSHAYGRVTEDSDVDVLVVMPTRNPVAQACKIRLAVDHPFPLDLLVRSPEHLESRLKVGDSFWQEVLSRGKVLYEKGNRPVGAKGRSRLRRRGATGRGKTARA
jgi:predicted nucleotidyltransferase